MSVIGQPERATQNRVRATRLAKTRALKQGMMHNLLTGKIRLV
jgi:hypothetical protein